ncbi:MAG: hypothetical protein HC772_18820 [Leptolyngbyaceae cyanobacterium CRU_2_3]|nr:hypothetical protein [Leptolyngbyaceae cyanobacterium CRU_2_3]
MYHLFIQHDLDSVEVNPLAVAPTGELMVLDGKVMVNDAALGRHDSLAAMMASIQAPLKIVDSLVPTCELKRVAADGNIAVFSNGTGLTLATLELLKQAQGKPASFVDLGEEQCYGSPQMPLSTHLTQGLDLILQDTSVKVVLVNLLCSSVSCLQVAEVLQTIYSGILLMTFLYLSFDW